MEIPEVDNYQELAQKIQASFELPWQISKLHDMEKYYLAPLAPPCLCWKDFLLPPNPKFPCWDIREAQLEKTVVYVQALQFWAEKSNPPTSRPTTPFDMEHPGVEGSNGALCLLLLMMPSWSGVAPPEGFLEDQPEGTIPERAQPASTDLPLKRPLQKKQPLLGASGGTEYSPDTVQGTNLKGRGLPNLISWVERSIASLQAGYCHQTGPSSLP